MKSTIIAILLLNISGGVAFTARPPLAMNDVTRAAVSSRSSTNLHGILDRLRKKEDTATDDVPTSTTTDEAISPEMTEMALTTEPEECIIPEEEEELTETQKLLKQVKEAGTAGAISYALWELAFWGVSLPVCVLGYREVTGHWPDFSNKEDLEKVGAEAFAFVNFARLAVPLRIGLALSTTGWVDENIVKKFMKKDDNECVEPEE